MLVKDVAEARATAAGDGSELRELLHPERDPAALGYSLAHAIVKPGRATIAHTLSRTEVYYIVEGRGTMHVGDESQPVRAGHAVHVPPGAVQWIENTGSVGLAFLCIVDPPWAPECEVVHKQAPPAGGR
jgi:mannose-6-phosphate isomerase-like protein (cupin superfamily)